MKLLWGFFLLGILMYTVLPIHHVESPHKVELVQGDYDTVRNPYAPPIRYLDSDYTQVGYLKREDRRIPLFGKPANLRRDLWYYYTIIDGIKVPFTFKKKKSIGFPGCDSVSSKDIVQVEGDNWTVELYEASSFTG
jgi:hypothetical protein